MGDEPPGVRDVRDTNLCRIHVALDRAAGRALVFAAIDNLWKGAAGQAVQNLNLMLGLAGDGGARSERPDGFFRSRWVEAPGGRRGARPGRAGARLPGRGRSPAG